MGGWYDGLGFARRRQDIAWIHPKRSLVISRVSTSLASGSASAASAIFLRGMLSDGGARCPARTTSDAKKFRSRERPARPPSCAPSEPARGSVPMLPMTPSRTVSGPELADRTVGTVLHGMTASIRQAARREIVQK